MVFNPHGKRAGGLIQAEGSQGLRRAPCPKLADRDNAAPFLAVSNVKITPSLRSHWVACGGAVPIFILASILWLGTRGSQRIIPLARFI